MSTLTRPLKFVTGLFSDKGLTRKAYLNAITAILDYVSSLVVGFFLTPLMVVGLGDYFYGLWQVLNRLIGYISPASGRPTYALKWTLANQQESTDYDQKRRYVGSTLVIWLLFLPLLIGLGGIISWFVPYWVHAVDEYVWIVRLVAALLVTNLVISTLSSVPQVTLQGENLGYKRMGLSVMLVFVGGSFTWLALYFKTGLVGVAASVVGTTLVSGMFFLWVVRNYTPWFGVSRPHIDDTRQMLGLSWWFLGWNFVTSLLLASDIVVLGLLNSIASVTNYSLTKYVPETMIGAIVIVVFGIAPGLGSIIGKGEYKKAAHLRGEIMTLIWLVLTALGTTILVWNKSFLGLWIGLDRYSGSIPNLLIVVGAVQLAFIRTDGNLIDLTLRLKSKVLLGLLAVIISISAASVAVGYFKLGIVGLCFGIIAGRLIISIGYPVLIGRFLGISLSSQILSIIRPATTTILFFVIAILLDGYLPALIFPGLKGWLIFFVSTFVTGVILLLLSFYTGLTSGQRKNILLRVRAMLTAS